MRTVCPLCSTTYEVPDALLDPGRAVRCARCAAQWVAYPLENSASARVPTDNLGTGTSPLARPEPHGWTAVERLVSPPTGPLGRSRLRAAWLAGIAVVVLFGWAVITWRPEIIEAWPPSMRLYGMFGLDTLAR